MNNGHRVVPRLSGRNGALAALLMVFVIVSSACGGKGTSPSGAGQAGASGSLGAAAGSASGAPATAPAASAAAAAATPRPATSTPAAQGQTNALDPCKAATKQEVEAAAGFPVSDGELHRYTPDYCYYKEAAGRRVVTGEVYIYAMRGGAARRFYDDYRSHESRATDVPGLGDQAFLTDSGTATALRGDVFVHIEVVEQSGAGDAEKRDRLINLMRIILGRV